MNHIKKNNYLVNEILIEKSVEQSVDTDIVLPDYCADISNILQSFAFVNIQSGSIGREQITIEGHVLIRVLYLSEGELYAYEQSVPFSKSIEHRCDTVGAVLDISSYLQYLNCRANGSRKIEAHGAFVLAVKVSACSEVEVIDGVEEEHIQLNKDSLSACTASGTASVTVNVNQVVDIGTDKPPVKSIIRNTSAILIEQTKQVSGKVLVKGELKIKTLYKSETGTIEYIENSLPLSQILELEGVDENSTVDIKLKLSSLDIALKPSALGNMSLLDIHACAAVYACSYNCVDFPVLKDAYSTDYACECSFKEVCVDRIVDNISKEFIHKFAIDRIQELSAVTDVWCDEMRTSARLEEHELVISGTLKAYVLYETLEGEIGLKSGETDFCLREPIDPISHLKCEPNIAIIGCDYVLGDESAEIRVKISVNAVVFDCVHQRVVDDITLSDTPLKKEAALVVCYAQKGDSLWDIASRYHTSMARLMQANHLESEQLSANKALIIWN